MLQDFPHQHAGHCESGTLSGLLRHRGLALSEPLVFGIGGGLFFLHLPFIKVGGIPLTAYRDMPRAIIKRCSKRLGINIIERRFGSADEGMRHLDALLERNIPVGMQTSVFWLPYFPPDMRFQFNGHNLIAYAKQGNDYCLSDPVFEQVVTCPADDLRRARFAKGVFAPKGLIYYPGEVNTQPDLAGAVRVSIRSAANRMLKVPLPYFGINGIRHLSRSVLQWPRKHGDAAALVWVGSVIRMQEEIGTGGAGFRFMYAAFLMEAADVLGLPALKDVSNDLTQTGDLWREFALQGALLCKGRVRGAEAYAKLSDLLAQCADREAAIYRRLLQIVAK
jgi:hypothetical protein